MDNESTTQENPELREKWDRIFKEVDEIKDALGKPVDEDIKETVVAMRALGFNTSQSCEGHLDWGLPYPWVEFVAEGAEEKKKIVDEQYSTAWGARQEGKTEEEISILFESAHASSKELRTLLAMEAAKMMGHLSEFYENRRIPYDRMIYVSISDDACRTGINGGFIQDTVRDDIKAQNLIAYRGEMKAFARFLKGKFFASK